MPTLSSPMHIRMLRDAEKIGQPARDGIYGLHWGDPERLPHLQTIRDHWLLPYVRSDGVALEIGPGGGRWTRYLLPFCRIYAVDYHAELLAELRKNFAHSHIIEVLNNGTDFPGVPSASVDFVFSFGTFVHLDLDIIEAYLANLRAVVRPTAQLVIQYSDKDKPEAQKIAGFSDNDPRRMRAMVENAGYRIVEEDTATLNHSSIMRFVLSSAAPVNSKQRQDENRSPVVSEAIFVDEVLERNTVIGHLYEERDALRRRIQELEKSLGDARSRSNESSSQLPSVEGEALITLLQAAWKKGELAHPAAELITAYVMVATSCAAPAKPLYEAARFCRENGLYDMSAALCEAGFALAPSNGNTPFEIYAGLQEEYLIAANYSHDPMRKDRGFAACNWLASNRRISQRSRDLARWNLFFYINSANSMMPSFSARPVGFVPPEGYRAMNPSVARQGDCVALVQRCVNYTLTEDGKYEIPRGSLAHTRNYLLKLDSELNVQSAVEVLPPADMPASSAGRIQDPRLFEWLNALWCCAGVRDLMMLGQCEQMLARIDVSTGACHLTDWHVLRFGGAKRTEKNWMPRVKGEELQFIYLCDPTRFLDDKARTIVETTPPIAADEFRGGTQAIGFEGGWLALIHEVSERDKRRYYQHRFIWFDGASKIRKISRPFFFHRKGVEFAAGLAWHPDTTRLLVSYGVADRESWIATVDADEVWGVLEDIEHLPLE